MLDASTDSGLVGDNLTNITKPRFDGTAEPGSTVTIYSGGIAVGTGVAAGGVLPNHQHDSAIQPDGLYSITAPAVDAAGNVGNLQGVLGLTIDTTPPPAPSAPSLDASTTAAPSATTARTSRCLASTARPSPAQR